MKKQILFYVGYIAVLSLILFVAIFDMLDKTTAFLVLMMIGLVIIWYAFSPGYRISIGYTPYMPQQPTTDMRPKEYSTRTLQTALLLVLPIVICMVIIYYLI